MPPPPVECRFDGVLTLRHHEAGEGCFDVEDAEVSLELSQPAGGERVSLREPGEGRLSGRAWVEDGTCHLKARWSYEIWIGGFPDMAHAHEQTIVYEYDLERRDADITGSGVYREPTPGPDPRECDVPLDVEGTFELRRSN